MQTPWPLDGTVVSSDSSVSSMVHSPPMNASDAEEDEGPAPVDNDRLLQLVLSIQPGVTEAEFEEVLTSVRDAPPLGFSDDEVFAWGRAFFASRGVPQTTVIRKKATSDRALLRTHQDSLELFARDRLNRLRPSRLNSDRVREVTDPVLQAHKEGRVDESSLADPIDWSRFLDDIFLASSFGDEGVPIFTDPDFQAACWTGPAPPRYSRLHPAINAHLVEDHDQEFVCFVSVSRIRELDLHVQNLGLAPKHGKVKGRPTCNCSGVALPAHTHPPGPRTPLNSRGVTEEATRRWGAIHHPTIGDIATAILRHAICYGWSEVVLFKEDLNGFFKLFSFAPSDVHLMAFQVFDLDLSPTPNVVAISLAGNFGWCAMPFAAEVVTRLLRVSIGVAMHGLFLMYVDDMIGVSSRAVWRRDRDVAVHTAQALLGPSAVAADKADSTERETGGGTRSLDIIGWNFNLDTRLVSVARINQLRALHWFLAAGDAGTLRFEDRERLCSLAERYSAVFVELRILMRDLYQLLGGQDRAHRHTILRTPPRSRTAIMLWQAYLVASEVDRGRCLPTGRPISSFANPPPEGIVEFDGSLIGVGWRLLEARRGTCVASAWMVVPEGHLPVHDSSYQNTMELTALALALTHAVSLGWRRMTVSLSGDSDTVLHWSQSRNFRSDFAVSAAAVFIAVCAYADIHVANTSWISSEANALCDRLSRGDPAGAVRAGDCGAQGPRNMSEVHPFRTLLETCRPDNAPSDFGSFSSLWAGIRHVLVSMTTVAELR